MTCEKKLGGGKKKKETFALRLEKALPQALKFPFAGFFCQLHHT